MGKDRLERRIGIAAGNRFTCGRGTEERAARGASVRLVSHTLGRPWLPEHRRQGGGRGFDLRLPGGHRYRSHSLLLGTIATAVSLDSHFPTPSRPLRPPLLYGPESSKLHPLSELSSPRGKAPALRPSPPAPWRQARYESRPSSLADLAAVPSCSPGSGSLLPPSLLCHRLHLLRRNMFWSFFCTYVGWHAGDRLFNRSRASRPSGMTARGVAVLGTVGMAVKRSINLYRSYESGWCILSVDV